MMENPSAAERADDTPAKKKSNAIDATFFTAQNPNNDDDHTIV